MLCFQRGGENTAIFWGESAGVKTIRGLALAPDGILWHPEARRVMQGARECQGVVGVGRGWRQGIDRAGWLWEAGERERDEGKKS